MFNFKPQDDIQKVPYFDDVKASDGWEGHTTGKSLDKLQSEIATNLSLVGCIFTGCQKGSYGDRHGFQIHFAMKAEGGQGIPSRLDIACLPLNPRKRIHTRRRGKGSGDWRIEATQKMALYMTAKAIKGMYFLNVMSPAYIPFLSLMLDKKGQTLGQQWIQAGQLSALLPPPMQNFKEDGDVIDGTVI